MAIQKFVTFNTLNKYEQIASKDCTISLKILENSGNYLIHKDILRHQILKKQGTLSTKNRSEVSGGGRKPWKQKGTGQARAGSNRSPLWRGGGVIFGPKPKSVTFKLNKKERNLSLQTLLYNHRKNIYIIPEHFLTVTKTKNLVLKLKSLDVNLNKKILFVVSKKTNNLFLSLRNLPNVDFILASNLNTFSIFESHKIIITLPALNDLKEIYCD
jgi:large subunit ribosomal protein L4